MKNFFKKLAKYVVAAYANRLYRKAVKIADKRHEQERTTIYVLSSFRNSSHLTTCNRTEFRRMKMACHIYFHHIDKLKEGCWYHTGDARERNGMNAADKEARRIAFMRMMLKRAKLA